MAAHINFDGVDGEARDEDHKGWSDLVSFSRGIHKPMADATGSGRRRGDVVWDDLVCGNEPDKASPKLAEAVCKGKVFPKVEIHSRHRLVHGCREADILCLQTEARSDEQLRHRWEQAARRSRHGGVLADL